MNQPSAPYTTMTRLSDYLPDFSVVLEQVRMFLEKIGAEVAAPGIFHTRGIILPNTFFIGQGNDIMAFIEITNQQFSWQSVGIKLSHATKEIWHANGQYFTLSLHRLITQTNTPILAGQTLLSVTYINHKNLGLQRAINFGDECTPLINVESVAELETDYFAPVLKFGHEFLSHMEPGEPIPPLTIC